VQFVILIVIILFVSQRRKYTTSQKPGV